MDTGAHERIDALEGENIAIKAMLQFIIFEVFPQQSERTAVRERLCKIIEAIAEDPSHGFNERSHYRLQRALGVVEETVR